MVVHDVLSKGQTEACRLIPDPRVTGGRSPSEMARSSAGCRCHGHGRRERRPAGLGVSGRNPDRQVTLGKVLDGVVNEVDKNLGDSVPVGVDARERVVWWWCSKPSWSSAGGGVGGLADDVGYVGGLWSASIRLQLRMLLMSSSGGCPGRRVVFVRFSSKEPGLPGGSRRRRIRARGLEFERRPQLAFSSERPSRRTRRSTPHGNEQGGGWAAVRPP